MRFRPWRHRPRGPRPLRRVAILPTLITLGNAVCGMMAIFSCFKPDFEAAGFWILGGMVFDALDGKVARATGTASQFGAQLDSLCDALTFGVAPAVMVWYATLHRFPSLFPHHMVTVGCVFYAMAAIIRLARFNIETTSDLKSHMEFSGLPSPAAAGVIASTFVLWRYAGAWADDLIKALPPAVFLIGVLMISRVRYPHILNRLFGGFSPFVQLVEIVVGAVLIFALRHYALFALFVGYAMAGPAVWLGRRFIKRPAPAPESPPETPAEPPKEEEPLF